jgi:hypothetical protein
MVITGPALEKSEKLRAFGRARRKGLAWVLQHFNADGSLDATEGQFAYAQVCKSSWGSSLLYQITGETDYLNWSCRMGDWYIETQRPEGCWHWEGYRTLGSRIELTLEFVMHLDTLISGLA